MWVCERLTCYYLIIEETQRKNKENKIKIIFFIVMTMDVHHSKPNSLAGPNERKAIMSP